MISSLQDNTQSAHQRKSQLGLNDPLLQELWAVKASLNSAAGYSVERLAEQARQFDLDAVIVELYKQANENKIIGI